MWDYLIVPFAWIMQQAYKLLFNNYALALIVYAFVTKLIIFPMAMKQQKNQLNMVRMRPYTDELRKKYGSNQERYNAELQKLYQREGYNPMSSCLPLLIQLPFIFLIYAIVRHPLTYVGYMEMFTKDTAQRVFNLAVQSKDFLSDKVIKVVEKIEAGGAVTAISNYELEIYNAVEKAGIAADYEIGGSELFGIINLSGTPADHFWSWMLLIPILAGATSFLISWISQKLNKPMQDPAMTQQQGCSNNMMMYLSPIMSIWFSYTFNCALGFYWIINNVFSLAQTLILHKMYDPAKVLQEVEVKMQREKDQKKEKRAAAAEKKRAAIEAGKKKKKQ